MRSGILALVTTTLHNWYIFRKNDKTCFWGYPQGVKPAISEDVLKELNPISVYNFIHMTGGDNKCNHVPIKILITMIKFYFAFLVFCCYNKIIYNVFLKGSIFVKFAKIEFIKAELKWKTVIWHLNYEIMHISWNLASIVTCLVYFFLFCFYFIFLYIFYFCYWEIDLQVLCFLFTHEF